MGPIASEIIRFYRLILVCGWGLLTRYFSLKSQSDKLDPLNRYTMYFQSVNPKNNYSPFVKRWGSVFCGGTQMELNICPSC